MTVSDSHSGLAVIACGAATVTAVDATTLTRNGPSFFADPAAWLVTAAVRDALDTCPEELLSTPDDVGIVVVSNECTARTMRDIASSTGKGLVSPLRFAGANPGVLAGLPCITWKLRGPTLTFSMDPAAAVEVAATVVTAWLRRGQARYVLIAAHRLDGELQLSRCVIIRAAEVGEPDGRERLPGLLALPEPAPPEPAPPEPALPEPALPEPALPEPAAGPGTR
jgi:hypothetical protein